LAGVSQKTVSRVLNGEPYVKDEVRTRVLAAVEELGYRRNNVARALNSGRSQRIGLIALGTALYGPASLMIALERATRSTGYSLSVVNTVEGDPGGVAGAVGHLIEQGVDGIVLSEPIDEGNDDPLKIDIPVLTFGRFPGLEADPILITGGYRASARTGTPDGLARRRPASVVGFPRPAGRLAPGAGRRRRARASCAGRRLVARFRLRSRSGAGPEP
jgi:DNA-binding LacI/PurR family transcriptional regulator